MRKNRRGWYGQSYRHSLAAKGIRTTIPQHLKKMKGTYYDSLGVRVKEVELRDYSTAIDAAIADVVKAVNDAGFESIQSMSGIKLDYLRSMDRFSPNGYIGFWKNDLKPGQEEQIKRAAEDAGLYAIESDIFFTPAISVRTGVLKSGKTHEDIIKEANKISGLKVGIPDFMERLPARDRALERLLKENGGYIPQHEIAGRWEKFTKALTGRDVSVQWQ